MKRWFLIIMGALFIAAGVLATLNTLGIADINISLDGWWTLFIIIPALRGLITDKEKTWHILFLLFGVYLLLAARDVIKFGLIWDLFVPLVIVVVGIKWIVKALSPKGAFSKEKTVLDAEYSVDGTDMKMTNIRAVFGGAKVDLTDMQSADYNMINMFCLFGGVEIIVPENVEVKSNAFCIFGGISDKRSAQKKEVEKTAQLLVNGFCMFGGAEIK